ncbi:hypothetical protein KSF_072970 [Reticulibacter mediterranei]|uniref:Uncharacterized protein n=2 Tax=Reticulibacter mediterranei TaxID=2778369 RepID=A0A8J3ISU3_9CHLR|nr:hypothetical protein KSF_072970 [Reticulibacter mediterranei]
MKLIANLIEQCLREIATVMRSMLLSREHKFREERMGDSNELKEMRHLDMVSFSVYTQ